MKTEAGKSSRFVNQSQLDGDGGDGGDGGDSDSGDNPRRL